MELQQGFLVVWQNDPPGGEPTKTNLNFFASKDEAERFVKDSISGQFVHSRMFIIAASALPRL